MSPVAPWSLFAGGLGVAALAVAARLPWLVAALPRCPFHALTGLPCPTCGVSRALLALARGDLGTALAFHPLAALAAVAAPVGALWAAAHLLAPRLLPLPRLDVRRQVLAARAAAIAVLANWVYLLASPPPT